MSGRSSVQRKRTHALEPDTTDHCEAWQAGRCTKGRKCRFRHAKYRRIDNHLASASVEQFIIQESNLVTYGPGLEIRQIIPGYDLYQIILQLPIDTGKEDIEDLFLQQGLAAFDFHVFEISEDEKSVWATVFAKMQNGGKLVAEGLRNRGINLEVRHNAMWTSETTSSKPALTVTWDIGERRMTRSSSNSSSSAFSTVYEALGDSPGARMKTCYLFNSNTGSTPEQEALTVEFDTWENAQIAARTIESKGITSVGCNAHTPYQYSIQIPFAQYEVQKKEWVTLTKRKRKQEACVKNIIGEDSVTIQLQGQNRKLISVLKRRVEKLTRGEILEGTCWHDSFASSKDSAAFFQHLRDTTAVYLQCDPDIRALRLFGGPKRVDQARSMLQQEVQQRESVMATTRLTGASATFFKREGFTKLQELVGENKVNLKVTSNRTTIAVPGGEDATHHFRRLLEESLVEIPADGGHTSSDKSTCPVCLNETLHPERLACGHAYCPGCLNDLLISVVDSKKFPIVCIGKEATCNVPIELSFIRLFLPQATFKRLLEAAFVSYLEQNPAEFQYCATSGCTQTFRRQTSDPVVLSCPSCLASTCSSCGAEHDNNSCEEYYLQLQERLFVTLARSQGYRRCPGCNIVVEKNGGCDSMYCRCNRSLNWRDFTTV